ncbi:MAG: hypothetical protein KA388_00340 [Rhodocyclaceae bacterium]|nr:hypothetical protein [Rhodocyclaceae bacterium]MBP6108245.1 hypothetical protein [Rhodocyclaceae bacterium]MBP6278214.1 hypothetical protein [Rhodocyclaceae bacterium]
MTTPEARQDFVVTSQVLVPLVRQVLADAHAELLDWSYTRLPLYGVNPVTNGIFRFAGKARSNGVLKPWSLILKQIHWLDLGVNGRGYVDAPSDWNYWKREALAFQSGLLDGSYGGLLPAKCYAVTEPAPTTVWIWLQDLGDDSQQTWTVERHLLAARHFGEFNGTHAGYQPSPDEARWLSTQHLRKWLASLNGWGMNRTASDASFWSTRFAQTAFPPGTDARLRHLLKHADTLCDLLAQQTQTVSHQDSHRANLFATVGILSQMQTTAIDWSFLGLAAIGEDLGTQVGGNLFKQYVARNEAKDYCAAATNSYLDALRQAGWRGNADGVRFAYAAAACLRYAPFGVMWLQGCLQANERGEISGLDNLAQVNGLSNVDALQRWGAAMNLLFDLGDEAMRLAGRL